MQNELSKQALLEAIATFKEVTGVAHVKFRFSKSLYEKYLREEVFKPNHKPRKIKGSFDVFIWDDDLNEG